MDSSVDNEARRSTHNVYLFVPNLIGYGRVILLLVAMVFMRECHVAAAWCYFASGMLDAIDGHAARILNQSSRFGAMLDQLVDRCATMCLLACLCTFYPRALFWLQLSMVIDVSGHWIHMHTASIRGADSHKSAVQQKSRLLRLYYTSRPLLFTLCACNELFYSCLYLLHFSEGPLLPVLSVGVFRLTAWLSLPLAVLKSIIALVQGVSAWWQLGQVDIEERILTATKNH